MEAEVPPVETPEPDLEQLRAQLAAATQRLEAETAWRSAMTENLSGVGLAAGEDGRVFVGDTGTIRDVFAPYLSETTPAPPAAAAAPQDEAPAAPPNPWDEEAYRAYWQTQTQSAIKDALAPVLQQNQLLMNLVTQDRTGTLLEQHAKPLFERIGAGHLLSDPTFREQFNAAIAQVDPAMRFDPKIVSSTAMMVIPYVLDAQPARPRGGLGSAGVALGGGSQGALGAMRGALGGIQPPAGGSTEGGGAAGEATAEEQAVMSLTGKSLEAVRAYLTPPDEQGNSPAFDYMRRQTRR